MKMIHTMLLVGIAFFLSCATQEKVTEVKSKETPSGTPVGAVNSLDTQLQNLTEQIVKSLSQTKRTKIAVIEFMNLQGESTDFGKFIAEELITRLFRTGKFEVIERQLLNKIIEEHQLNLSGMVDESSARELGKILGVDAIASGSVTDLGGSMKINARLISTESGKIFSVASVSITKDATVKKLTGTQESVPQAEEEVLVTDTLERAAEEVKPEETKEDERTDLRLELNGFILELKECTMSNRIVTCHMDVTNTTEDDKEFGIQWGNPWSKMYDNLGNEYILHAVKITNKKQVFWDGGSEYQGLGKKIMPGLTVPVLMYFEKVTAEATGIELLDINCGRECAFKFRRIPLEKK